jgi:hypothetical protein
MPKLVWRGCLQATSELSSGRVAALADRARSGIDGLADIARPRREFWKRRLDEAQDKWAELRDFECQQIAASADDVEPYEAKLICMMRANMARAQWLQDLYRLNDKSAR